MTTIQDTQNPTQQQHASTAPSQPAPASAKDTPRFLDRKGVNPAVGLIVRIVLLIAWWAVTAAGVFTPVQLTSPAAVVEATIGLLPRGDRWPHIGISVHHLRIGIAL